MCCSPAPHSDITAPPCAGVQPECAGPAALADALTTSSPEHVLSQAALAAAAQLAASFSRLPTLDRVDTSPPPTLPTEPAAVPPPASIPSPLASPPAPAVPPPSNRPAGSPSSASTPPPQHALPLPPARHTPLVSATSDAGSAAGMLAMRRNMSVLDTRWARDRPRLLASLFSHPPCFSLPSCPPPKPPFGPYMLSPFVAANWLCTVWLVVRLMNVWALWCVPALQGRWFGRLATRRASGSVAFLPPSVGPPSPAHHSHPP